MRHVQKVEINFEDGTVIVMPEDPDLLEELVAEHGRPVEVQPVTDDVFDI